MASPTYKAQGIVLGKTKLGESDLIITLLAEDGSKIKGVAKGSRKPNSRLSSHLELFNTADLHCVQTKGLDIIKETRLVKNRSSLHVDPDRAAAAACICELLLKITESNLEYPRMFALTETALDCLGSAPTHMLPALLAADILKTTALAGLRPSLRSCACCGSSIDIRKCGDNDPYVAFSFTEGGIICDICNSARYALALSDEPSHQLFGCENIPVALIKGVDFLISSTFAAIAQSDVPQALSIDLLQFSRQWSSVHIGSRLKSVDVFISLYAFRN